MDAAVHTGGWVVTEMQCVVLEPCANHVLYNFWGGTRLKQMVVLLLCRPVYVFWWRLRILSFTPMIYASDSPCAEPSCASLESSSRAAPRLLDC